jgi:hypothetical protein
MKFLARWWAALRDWLLRRPKRVRLERLPEVPNRLAPNVLYVESEGDSEWLAVMRCPCDCGETLYLNLLPRERPRWDVSQDEEGWPSLRPSVWRKAGCRSHFWLRHGLVVWVRDEEEVVR